jgi:hypothetical protein
VMRRLGRVHGSGRVGSVKGEGALLGAGAGSAAGAGMGAGGDNGDAVAEVPGPEAAGCVGAAEPAGAEITGGPEGVPGMIGATPIVGIMPPYPPGGPEGVYPQSPPTHGVGKSSHVSQWVHPTAPAASATATSRRLIRPIPQSFP